jgi:broad specificity phosphatase PhoE
MHVTCVDLLRHGAVEGGERYLGSTDDALSARGWEQMRAAVGDACPWTHIISSPLKRCAEFAAELAQRHTQPLTLDTRLREIHFGTWEGQTAIELLASHPEHIARFWNDPLNHPPPEGEPLPVFEARVLAAWNELLARHVGKRVLIILHGGPIRTIIGHIHGLTWPARLGIEVPHASIRSLQVPVAGE